MTVIVPLTKGYEAIIDDCDAERVLALKWHAAVGKMRSDYQPVYAVHTSSRHVVPRAVIGMHKFIMGAPKGVTVDHRDRNGLDNRRHNLRVATYQQNAANQAESRGLHGFFGVRKHGNRFWARIDVGKKPICSAVSYQTAEEAALARDVLAIQHFGEFASLNFPQRIAKAA